jgi:hypothetical protein
MNELLHLDISEQLCYYEVKRMLTQQSNVLSLFTCTFLVRCPHHNPTMTISIVLHLSIVVVPFGKRHVTKV